MRTDREKHGLNGLVKSVHVVTSRLEEQAGQLTEKPWLSHTITFNRDGSLSEQVYYNPDGSEWRTVNYYSDSGKLLATRRYDSSGVLGSEVKYIYDDEGRLIAEQNLTQDGRVTTPTTYAYDSEGRKIKIQEHDSSGEANFMIVIEGTNTSVSAAEARRIETRYDGQGEAVEVKTFNGNGALVSRVEVRRNALGNPVEEMQYVGDGFPLTPCASNSCSTEKTAALTEEQQAEVARLFSPGTLMSKQTHKYDTDGRLVESKLTMMGMEASRQAFAYDDAGNKSEEVSYNGDGKFASKAILTREYDEHGNWTKELVSTASNWDAEFGLSTPAHVTRRVITYW
jgi:YD repeat-containing protein